MENSDKEIKEQTEELKETEAALAAKLELTNLLTTIIARTETLNMIANFANALIMIRQKDESRAFTEEEIKIIQNQVNLENKTTQDYFNKLQEIMGNKKEN